MYTYSYTVLFFHYVHVYIYKPKKENIIQNINDNVNFYENLRFSRPSDPLMYVELSPICVC